jgi:hypothetical protein
VRSLDSEHAYAHRLQRMAARTVVVPLLVDEDLDGHELFAQRVAEDASFTQKLSSVPKAGGIGYRARGPMASQIRGAQWLGVALGDRGERP